MYSIMLDVGGSAIDFPCTDVVKDVKEASGRKSRTWFGRAGSSKRAEYMVVRLVSSPVDASVAQDVEALFALDAEVDCAGAALNNGGATVTFTGVVTMKMVGGGSGLWIVSITLVEVGSNSGYTPVVSALPLTTVDSPDSGAANTNVLSLTPTYPGDASICYNMLAGVDDSDLDDGFGGKITVEPTTPEWTFLSPPFGADVVITGIPYVQFETSMSGVYSGTTYWALMDTMCKLYLVRSGVDQYGPISTGYAGVGLGGGVASLSFGSSSIVWNGLAGDRFRLEFYPRLRSQTGQLDNGQRQVICFGPVPGPRTSPRLYVGGVVVP
jgi:hypothetical protein